MSESGRGGLEIRGRGGDAGSPAEEAEEGLTLARIWLLREIADPDRRRLAGDGARVRLLDAGQQPQKRRLADAVRPDDPDASFGGNRERHVGEHERRAVGTAGAGERDTHGGVQGTAGVAGEARLVSRGGF